MLDAIGLRFEQAVPERATTQHRADVACFVGFVERSAAFLALPPARQTLPESLRRWLRTQGLVGVPGGLPELEPQADPSLPPVLSARLRELLQLPVPIDSWSTFLELFSATAASGPSYLAAAVRSFFAQGGRKCIIVRAGDPAPFGLSRTERLELIGELVPGWVGDVAAQAPLDPTRWRGLAHVFGLAEVSFVSLPDLPFLVHDAVATPPEEPAPVPPREFFVECSEPVPATAPTRIAPVLAPRSGSSATYVDWGRAVNLAAELLLANRTAGARKDVQLVASVPLPQAGTDADLDLLSALLGAGVLERLSSVRGGVAAGVSSAHVQLTYPWIGWEGSAELPEGLEPAEGALLGVLARGALVSGTFVSCADELLRHVRRLEPRLSQPQMRLLQRRNLEPSEAVEGRFLSLRQRVSLVAETVDGFALISDVTTSADEAWRPANVNRLMSIWVRALQRAAEDFVFEPSNERAWAGVRRRLEFVGERLFGSGALFGRNPTEAFEVRCGLDTMTQNDLDNGRLIAEVQFRPALPIGGIVVALSLNEARQISSRQVS